MDGTRSKGICAYDEEGGQVFNIWCVTYYVNDPDIYLQFTRSLAMYLIQSQLKEIRKELKVVTGKEGSNRQGYEN